MVEKTVELALRAHAHGNLTVAEMACRNALEIEPDNSNALNILGVIAGQVGRPIEAVAYLKKAVRAFPKIPSAAANLKHARNVLATWPVGRDSGPKYLVIKSWGFGFWADVSHVLGGLLLAEATSRIPVIYWGTNSLFGSGVGDEAFRLFFEPVSEVGLDAIAQLNDVDFFPAKWNRENLKSENIEKWNGKFSRFAALFFLARQENIAVSDFYKGVIDVLPWLPSSHPMYGKKLTEVYRYLVDKYLVPTDDIRAKCDAFFENNLKGKPFVAVHLRGGDKSCEDLELEESNLACLSALAEVDPAWRIFLLTDDDRWLSRVRAAYGSRVVATDCRRTSSNTGVHYSGANEGQLIGTEIMLDAYLARSANRFIGNGRSNVAAMIAMLKDWKPEDCILVRPSQLLERNFIIYIKEMNLP